MSETEEYGRLQPPLTFGGVAAYASGIRHRALRHLAGWSVACALLVVLAVRSAWLPTVDEAISHLPESCAIRGGHLVWPTPNPTVLAKNRTLSIIVNPGESRTIDHTADIQVEFGADALGFRSFLGWLSIDYPRWLEGTSGRSAVLPWWGAWKPLLLAGLVGVVALALAVSWSVLGILYALPASFLMAALGKRRSLTDTWRLMVVAMFPASTFMVLALQAYSWGRMNLLVLAAMWGVHWVVAWVYALGTILSLKRHLPTQESPAPVEATPNPFRDDEMNPPEPTPENPFQGHSIKKES